MWTADLDYFFSPQLVRIQSIGELLVQNMKNNEKAFFL